jgi:hypothetical protein
METLYFGPGSKNAKLRKLEKALNQKVFTFSLLSGYSCPFADSCLSKVVNGKIKDGANTQFRCFSASEEALFPAVYRARSRNFNLLRSLNFHDTYSLISNSLPICDIIRVHVAGDFFNQIYFDAWVAVAEDNPSMVFYAYTKSLRYWLNRRKPTDKPWQVNGLNNFRLTASYGGRDDALIKANKLRSALVVYRESETKLPIDDNDTLAYGTGKSFGLLLHGIQPKGTMASRAISEQRKAGQWGYGRAADKKRLSLVTV